MKYNKIVLLGTGKLFLDCLTYVSRLGIPYIGYDMSDAPQKMTKARADKEGLCYQWRERPEVYREIRAEKEPLLLLSVINPRIVPSSILDKENVLALNIHQALLPRHKGRNAEGWAIYDGDEVTGVTWHKMLSDVDAGEILAQVTVPITEKTTSYQLFREQLNVAYESFTRFMPLVLEGTEVYTPQSGGASDFHYSYEIPENGKINPKWEGEKISRLLRAMDYGGLNVMGQPYLVVNGQEYAFKSYRINRTEEARDEVVIEENTITVYRPGYEIKLLKCRLCTGENNL